MGKTTNSSYRKLKKMEKSKTKIKTTKTLLPKGQNITDTNFKVKKIVIKDQVRQHKDEEILSKKKLSCKELIGRLTHYNTAIKHDSLVLLKQLITDYTEEILQLNLSPLIESISKLILDESKDIRKEANKLLAIILSQTTIGQLIPLFPMMSSYLICGLTHIDTAIREDSLFFLDILLKWTPKLCVNSIPQFLPICLDLVSSSTSSSRTLTLNLESKLTSGKWRGNVLARISVLLSILVDSQTDTKRKEKISYKKNIKYYKDCLKENGKTYIPINLSLINYNSENNRLFSAKSQESQDIKKFNLKDFIEALVPLLFQAFIEMVPIEEDKFTDKTSTIISPEVSLVLKHILDILNCCWELLSPAEEEWFKSKFSKPFINSLITGRFPYSVVTRNDTIKKTKDKTFLGNDEFSLNCQMQNIMLIKFILLLTNPSLWSEAISCLKNCFRASEKLSPKECSLLISCCKIIISNSYGETQTFLGKLNKLSRSTNTSLASQAISAMYTIAIDKNLSALQEDVNFQSWLGFLPEVLTEYSLSSRTLDIIYEIARRNFPAFSTALDGRIEYILDKIPEIKIDNSLSSREEAQIKIGQLLFWVNDWDVEMLNSLQTAIDNNYWGELVTSHIRDVFEIKFKDNPQSVSTSENESDILTIV